MTSPNEIGQWLLNTIEANGRKRSYQSRLVRQIRDDFGDKFSYRNDNGNWAIDRTVLREFNKLKPESVQWDRSDQSWRCVDDDELERIRDREARRAESKAERDAARAAYEQELEQN